MIRDLMVWLDGGVSDEIRLAAVADIARRLESQVVIGLFLNVLALPAVVDADVAGSAAAAHLHSLPSPHGLFLPPKSSTLVLQFSFLT